MAVGVVDILEVVDIEHHQSHLPRVALVPVEFFVEPLFPVAPVPQGRQPVGPAQAQHFVPGLFQLDAVVGGLGDVVDDDRHLGDLVRCRMQRHEGGVLVHAAGFVMDRQFQVKLEYAAALFPGGVDRDAELEHRIDPAFEPVIIQVGKQVKHAAADGLLRGAAAVDLHEAVEDFHLELTIQHQDTDIRTLDNIQQPVQVLEVLVVLCHATLPYIRYSSCRKITGSESS